MPHGEVMVCTMVLLPPALAEVTEVAGDSMALLARLSREQRDRYTASAPCSARIMFTVSDLRPGTLDSLLALSNDLVKSNIFIMGVSHKIRRQIEDLERVGGVEHDTLTVDGVPVDSYLTRSPSLCLPLLPFFLAAPTFSRK
ncbi:hypothetical protein ZWY2020_010790 [Hordeum vulgare]|nr:hypothetical protein ZWY2020_010790 [Hordeum vulgare]